MSPTFNYLSTENPVFRSYLFYTGVLTMKMMLMTLLTIRQRLKNNALCTEEDAIFLKGKVNRTNENVERVRRCHRNDLENVYLFQLIAFAYIFTDPSPPLANNLYLVFAGSRIIHTLVYGVVVVPQPAKGIAWLAGFLVTGYMALKTVTHFAS